MEEIPRKKQRQKWISVAEVSEAQGKHADYSELEGAQGAIQELGAGVGEGFLKAEDQNHQMLEKVKYN